MTKGKIVLNFLKSLQFRLIVIFIVLAILPGAVIHIGLIKSYEARALQIRQIAQSEIGVCRWQLHIGDFRSVCDVGSCELRTCSIERLQTRASATYYVRYESASNIEFLQERQFTEIDICEQGISSDSEILFADLTEIDFLSESHHREIKVIRQRDFR